MLGGGGGIDYQHLKQMLEDVVDKRFAALPPPTALPDMPFESLFGALDALQREVNRIPKDMPDSTPLVTRVEAIRHAIEGLPPPEKLNLTQVIDALNELRTFLVDIFWTASEQTGTKIGAANAIAINSS